MPAVPSIKGSVFRFHVEHVSKLLAAGEISQQELVHYLEPEDLTLLKRVVLSSEWYDIRAYARFLEMLRDLEGGGSNEYLRRKGATTAERLFETGIYQQLDYLDHQTRSSARWSIQGDPQARFLAFGRGLRLALTLSSSILNFSRQQAKPDPEWSHRYLIEISEASPFPEVLCWTMDGFVNRLAAQHDAPEIWAWEREREDLIVFRMTRSLTSVCAD